MQIKKIFLYKLLLIFILMLGTLIEIEIKYEVYMRPKYIRRVDKSYSEDKCLLKNDFKLFFIT